MLVVIRSLVVVKKPCKDGGGGDDGGSGGDGDSGGDGGWW